MLKKGDNIFFISTNKSLPIHNIFNLVQTIGLVSLNWENAGLEMRNSNFDREMRDNFYKSKVAIIALGTSKEREDLGDNWAVPELEAAKEFGVKCFVYITPEISKDEFKVLNLKYTPILVKNMDDFKKDIQKKLEDLMGHTS